MSLFISDYLLESGPEALEEADQATACAGQPATFYEAVDPDEWAATTAYALGDVVRPTTRNGFVYEVTTAGTTGGAEPGTWAEIAGNTTNSGTVTFTARVNRVLFSTGMVPGDFSLVDGTVSGRGVLSAQKAATAVHTTGDADHQAWVDTVNKRLIMVLVADTSLPVTAGSSTGTIGPGRWDVRDGQAA